MHRIEAYTRLAIIFIIIITILYLPILLILRKKKYNKTIRKIRFILFNISYNIRNNFVCTFRIFYSCYLKK